MTEGGRRGYRSPAQSRNALDGLGGALGHGLGRRVQAGCNLLPRRARAPPRDAGFPHPEPPWHHATLMQQRLTRRDASSQTSLSSRLVRHLLEVGLDDAAARRIRRRICSSAHAGRGPPDRSRVAAYVRATGQLDRGGHDCSTMMRRPHEPGRSEPTSDEPRRDHGSRPSWPPSTGARRRPIALVVDDSEETRELYAWCMRAAGWLVEAVPSGEEALLVAAVLVPDVIVMDLNLPVIGGLEATRRLKADPDTQHIPIVAVSGIDRGQGEALATEAGCEAFLEKPCQPEQLRALLERLVAERPAGPR